MAVFLSHLEYFSGIVFLTTNRIDVFDNAMKSRIHLALGYAPPEPEMRRLLWAQSLGITPPEEVDIDIAEAVDGLARIALNGREISNAINTAKTLARFEGKPLRLSHIETVLGVKHEFDISLNRMKLSVSGPVRQGSILGSMVEEPEELLS